MYTVDTCPHVGCKDCAYFKVNADLNGIESICKRIDHKKVKFAIPRFKSYDCGCFHIPCGDFIPKHPEHADFKDWTNFNDFWKVYVETWLPYGNENITVAFTINGDTSVRYHVPLSKFIDGTMIIDGVLQAIEKTYYAHHYNIVHEKIDGVVINVGEKVALAGKMCLLIRRMEGKMKPILFNTDMVRAIQNGTKTVTRRVMKGVPETAHMFLGINQETQKAEFLCGEIRNEICADFGVEIALPYKVGDILYVRETWRYVYDLDEHERLIKKSGRYIYYADNPNPFDTWITPDGTKRYSMPWKPSIHMPKDAARIFLRVTNVRVERLQDIRYEDCLAEGVQLTFLQQRDLAKRGLIAWNRFSVVWDSTVKKSYLNKYGWDANPWVWVIKFERISKEEAYGTENRT